MSEPIQEADIIFPQATKFSDTLNALKKSSLSISNRLSSIAQDAAFVCQVAEAYDLPLVANERCGSWYIPPDQKAGSAYFKSTDGHVNQWSFSLRRLNTQVVDIIAKRGGCILVDSTRRGKRMPDALSKTIPIWCCVLNRVLFPHNSDAHELFTPPISVPQSEHSQIESRLDGFVANFQQLGMPLDSLRAKLAQPLRPFWVTADSMVEPGRPEFPGFHTVVLCTASRRTFGNEMSEGGYVQGAGDDSEGWAHGLTASIYWANKKVLHQTTEDNLPQVITELVLHSDFQSAGSACLISPTTGLYVGAIGDLMAPEQEQFDAVITIGPKETIIPPAAQTAGKHLKLNCGHGKLGSRDLRLELPKISEFFRSQAPFNKVLVRCSDGSDLSVGVALAISCKYVDEDGVLHTQAPRERIDKDLIRKRLSWITTSIPDVRPARSTLQSVNAFLMSNPF